MASRLELHEELCLILGSKNVYFQPPESIKMQYPCIRYSESASDLRRANDKIYLNTKRYEVIVIDSDPESDIYENILNHFQMCGFDRGYASNNLNHKVLTLYY